MSPAIHGASRRMPGVGGLVDCVSFAAMQTLGIGESVSRPCSQQLVSVHFEMYFT